MLRSKTRDSWLDELSDDELTALDGWFVAWINQYQSGLASMRFAGNRVEARFVEGNRKHYRSCISVAKQMRASVTRALAKRQESPVE